MATGAAWFTIVAVIARYRNIEAPTNADVPWPAALLPLLPFFGGLLWLVLDSWYLGRDWWKLLLWGGGASGFAQFLGFQGLLPVAFGMSTWTIAVPVIVFKTDFGKSRDDCGHEVGLEHALPAHAVGLPRKDNLSANTQ